MLYYGNAMLNFVLYMLYYDNAMFNFVFYMLYYGNAMFNFVLYIWYYGNAGIEINGRQLGDQILLCSRPVGEWNLFITPSFRCQQSL